MELPLVVGVDGSDPSLRAVDWAVDEAARHGLALRVVYASLWERYEGFSPSLGDERPAARVMAEHIIATAEERASKRGPGVKLSSAVLPDEPVDALVEQGHRAFAVVVGHRGRGSLAELLLGSVSLGVAGRARCPIIVVRGAEPNVEGQFHRVVLGVGEATEASAAVTFAFREAEVRRSELLAVHAWRRPSTTAPEGAGLLPDAADARLDKAKGLLADALHSPADAHWEVPVRSEAVEGSARQALLDTASTADLLVVGARRRRGLFGLELGLVNHAALHHAPCPVAVVPQP